MADGYARAGGKPGVAVVTTGPAVGNVMAAVGDAYRDSVPLLVIASQIASDLVGHDRGAFHEMKDQLGMAAGAAAWARRVTTVAEIPEALNDAWHAMTDGRPRPAYLEIPWDVLGGQDDVDITPASKLAPAAALSSKVQDAARLLAQAQRPLIYVGGGVMWSRDTRGICELAERLQAPVATTCNGKGAIPEDHPLAAGYVNFSRPQWRPVWEQADLVLAVGTDFGEVATGGWALPAPQQLVRIDVDQEQLNRNYPATIGLTGDAAVVLDQLLRYVPRPAESSPPSAWAEHVRDLRTRLHDAAAGSDGMTIVEAMQRELGRDGLSVGDAAGVGIWQLDHLRVYESRTFQLPLGFGTLGFGVPAALGAQAAQPSRRVICLCGDGGFLFHGQELATAIQHDLNIVVLVVNDHAFGSIRRLQERHYQGHTIATDLVNPDFVRFAEAFGAFGLRIRHTRDLPDALATAFASGKAAVIEIPGPIAPPQRPVSP